MNTQHVDFPLTDADLKDNAQSDLWKRVSRVVGSIRDALNGAQSQSTVVRYNVPPIGTPVAAALPTASVAYLGQILQLDKNGAADDTAHICIRNAAGAYVWKQFTLI